MKTYNTLPKKYEGIEHGMVRVIDGYAYAVRRAHYTGEKDLVYRITAEEYNELRQEAQKWDCYQCEKTEDNLQLQICSYLFNSCDPYCQTTPYM